VKAILADYTSQMKKSIFPLPEAWGTSDTRERGLSAAWRSDMRYKLSLALVAALTAVPLGGAIAQVGESGYSLPLALAMKAATKAIATCASNGYPVSAVIVDTSGVIKLEAKGDHSTIGTMTSAFRKAYTVETSTPTPQATEYPRPGRMKETSMSSEKKVAVITGASQGMGAALVKVYRDRDYAVVATARSIKPTMDDQILAVPGDITDRKTAERAISEGMARFGRIDTLINNAGVFVAKPFTQYTEADYAAVLGVNLSGFFHITQLAIAEMEKRHSGRLILSQIRYSSYSATDPPTRAVSSFPRLSIAL
jgi:uncharacterized protein GlcG (DUF336 family)